MMKNSYKFVAFLFLANVFVVPILPITLVYNMRIRRVFNLEGLRFFLGEKKSIWMVSAVPIIYKRNRRIIDDERLINITDKRLTVGSLFNIRYRRSKFWIELTTGIERERLKSRGTAHFTQSRTALDDIVLSGGYIFLPSRKSQIILFGLAGFPTTRKVTLREAQDTLVGTRFFSLSIGSEFSYSFVQSLEKAFIFIFQNRFLHFFNRRWTPILPANAKIQPGNVTDLLFSLRYRKMLNTFEAGYNPTFFTNQAVILPLRTIKAPNAIRHSFYFSYSHIFEKLRLFTKPLIIGSGLSFARADRFHTRIFSIWANISIVF